MDAEKTHDFFISYTHKDEDWATWIAETLENNGYTAIIQAWDFRPGGSFVKDMHDALNSCARILLVMSKDYLLSKYCQAEWQSVFVDDPVGEKELVLPVRIDDVKPYGLLKARTYIDLYQVHKIVAVNRLLQGVGPKSAARKSKGYPGEKARTSGKSPLNNLPHRNPHFTGREDAFQAIVQAFGEGDTVSLTQTVSGLGGVGKTQIALEFAYRYASGYDCIWWLDAEKPETLFAGMLKLTQRLYGTDPMSATPDSVKSQLRDWTVANDRWLFIYDNAEEYDVIRDYLPQNSTGHGHVLITSRSAFWTKLGTSPLKVEVYTEEESIRFLNSRTKMSHPDNAAELAKELGGLPLALEHAAAYIIENDVTLVEYLTLYRRYKLALLNDGASTGEATVDVTWNVSIENIQRLTSPPE